MCGASLRCLHAVTRAVDAMASPLQPVGTRLESGRPFDELSAMFRRPLAGTLGVSISFVAIVLVVRRLSGEWAAAQLGGGELFIVGLCLACLGLVTKALWPKSDRSGNAPSLLSGMASLSLVLIAAALSPSSASGIGLAFLWAPLAVEESWSGRAALGNLSRRLKRSRSEAAASSISTELTELSGSNLDDDEVARRPTLGEETLTPETNRVAPGETVLQELTQSITGEGRTVWRGRLRTRIAVGQRRATAHVAFCPPLDETPLVEFRQLAGPAARAKLGQVLPYGARFDLKLAEAPDEPVEVELTFTAVPRPGTESDRVR